jgi:HK97 family phage major capsid protein
MDQDRDSSYLARLISTRNDLAKEADVAKSKRDAIVKVARDAGHEILSDDDDREFREYITEIKRLDAEIKDKDTLIADLDEEQQRKQDLRAGAAIAERASSRQASVTEQATYTKGSSRSYFADLAVVAQGRDTSGECAERLRRHAQDVASLPEYEEYRAGLNTTTGSGGSTVPPAYLLNEYITFARPGRPFADLVVNETLPEGTMQVNIPKMTSGSAVAWQATQNTLVQETDVADTYVTANVFTVAGQQTVSRQLLERSSVPVDGIIFRDLIAAHATYLDANLYTGSGTNQVQGINNISGIQTVATGGLTVPFVYAAIANAIQLVHSTRFASPDAILMHPRRWGWLTSLLDTQNRPLFLPSANSPMNAGGLLERVAPESLVGQVQGVPIIVDANIPTNLGGGSNQDPIYVVRSSDLVLYESGVRAEAFQETFAQNMSVLLQVSSYCAFASRYPLSIVELTGFTPPTWGS